MNKQIITGRLTRDPELTTLSTGTEKCRFSVAVDRRRQKDKEKETDFFDCAAFGKLATFVDQWFHKGSPITVIGRMESYRTEKDGVKVTYWTLNADEVEFQMGDSGNQGGGQAPAEKKDEQTGFTEVSTSELPF